MNRISTIFDNIFQIIFPLESEIRVLCRSIISPKKWNAEDKKRLERAISDSRFYDLIKENQMLTQISVVLETDTFISNEFAQDLIRKSIFSKARAHLQMKEYLSILRILHADQIQFVLPKALPYLYQLQHEFHKEVHDMDILIPISEFHKAARLLQKNGYVHLTRRQGDETHEMQHSAEFYAPKQEEFFYKHPFAIELHTSIVQTYAFSSSVLRETMVRSLTKDFFERKVKNIIGKDLLYYLSVRDVVTNLVIHAFFNHAYQSAMLFHEIALLIKNKHIKSNTWIACEIQSKKIGIQPYYYWFFCLFDWIYPSLLSKRVAHKLTRHKRNWNTLQKIAFFVLKFYIFHPKSNVISDWWKKILWAIIDGRILHSIAKKTVWRAQ